MFFPQLPLSSAGFSSAKAFKKELTLQGKFSLPIPDKLTSSDFPRRVQFGELLGEMQNGLPLLSPTEGILSKSASGNLLHIVQDGNWVSTRPYEPRLLEKQEFLEKLKKAGLPHLDFPKQALWSVFEKAFSRETKHIIFSPFTLHSHLGEDDLFFTEELRLGAIFFQNQIEEYFPKSRISRLNWETKKPFQEPWGNPVFWIHKETGLSVSSVKEHLQDGSALFFGPETLFHIVRALYFSIPFVQRHLTVYLVSKSGKLSSWKKEYFLRQGQSLEFLTQEFAKDYSVASFYSLYETPAVFPTKDLRFFSIHDHSFLILSAGASREHKPFPCIECFDCNSYCPTNANPFSLVMGSDKDFRKKECIECGICTVHCPSGINLRELIQTAL